MTAPPLIVGAGPTGLAAALFLIERGIKARIVDAASEPTATSKALGVNPRTLDILSGTGVEEAILAEGEAMHTLDMHQGGRRLARIAIDYAGIGARYPMTILPQARTEALLTEALSKRGVSVERGVALEALVQTADAVAATLRHVDGRTEVVEAPLMLGADGAHSQARHALDIDFPGSSHPEDWSLMDVEIEGAPSATAWANFSPDGPFVMLPFKGERVRLIGFGPSLLDRLPKGWKARKVVWTSGFHVSHRVAEVMTRGRVALAGDAAHIHSPIGARGMNLGIEDAYVFAACAERFLSGEAGAIEAYGRSRRAVDAAVVARVERLTNAVRATGRASMVIRPIVLALASHIPALRRTVMRQAFGMDHPLVIP